MGRTILDLFQNKVLDSSGKTAEETYSVRNSKDIPISSRNVLINNTAVPVINSVRRNLGRRKSETFLELDGVLGIPTPGVGGVGLRPLSVLSSPFIYGTAILRISTQQSDQVNQMKQATGGSGGDRGVIGGFVEKVGEGVRDTLSKVGVKFPSQINPTSFVGGGGVDAKEKYDIYPNIQENIPGTLAKIKEDAAGNLLGRILSQPQTPNQLTKNAAGAAVGFVKNKARGVLFGERSTVGFNTIDSTNINGTLRNPNPFNITLNYGSSVTFDSISEINDRVVSANGSTYSSGFIQSAIPFESTVKLSNNLTNTLQNATNPSVELDKRYDYLPETERPKNITNPLEFGKFSDHEDGTIGLANKTPEIIIPHKKLRENKKYSTVMADAKLTLNQRGIIYGNKRYVGDELNQTSIFNREVNEDVDDLNFIPLKFTLLSNSKTIYFRSIIDGITETFSPGWDSSKFIGNPFSFYTYTGVERSVSFNLKVAATTPTELKRNWERLSFLSSMVYPAGYQDETYITPPFIKFTLGNIYKGKEGFIDSLSYTFDDQMGWEIGIDNVMKDYKLPKKIDVSIGIKFLQNRINTDNYTKLYSFNPVS